MKKYIALLRGINVSGQKKIKMADLKNLFEQLGFTNVITYIQSGNVIFSSKMSNKEEIVSKIQQAIEKQFSFIVPTIIITDKELENTIDSFPYSDVDILENQTTLLISFLDRDLKKASLEEIEQYKAYSERIEINNSILYLYCPNGYGKSKLTNTFLEKKLDVVATTRNIKTVLKLKELCS